MSAKNFKCVVSADLMRRALLGVSTEETRYYLNGVHISAGPNGGAVLTATDGHLLISLHDPDAVVSGECIVQLTKPMKAALKSPAGLLDQRLLAIRCIGTSGRAFVADLPTKGPADDYSPYTEAGVLFDQPDRRVQAAQFGPIGIDGTYPDWRRIVPTKLRPDAPIPPINQAYVSRIASALVPDKTSPTLRLTATGDTPAADPVLVTFPSPMAPSGFAIIMPIRNEDAPQTVPAWASRPVPIAAE